MKCRECGVPSQWSLCHECKAIHWTEERTAQTRELNTRLPPRPPEPRSIPFCACGALSRLATWHGVTKCADCWRRAE